MLVLLLLATILVSGDDLYEALGVARTATERELRSAYRKLALKHHPDKQGRSEREPNAAERFLAISRAYQILADKEKRAVYDRYGEDGVRRFEAGEPPAQPDAGAHAPAGARAGFPGHTRREATFVFADADELFRHFFGVEEADMEAELRWSSPPPAAGAPRSAGGSRLAKSRFAGGGSFGRSAARAGGAARFSAGEPVRAAGVFARSSTVRELSSADLERLLVGAATPHGGPGGGASAPVRFVFFHSRAAPAASAFIAALLDKLAPVLDGIVDVYALDAHADDGATRLAAMLNVEALPALQAFSATSGRRLALALDEEVGALSSAALGRFALMALEPGSAPVDDSESLGRFVAVCGARARCGCALLLPARDEASPLWHALGHRLAPDWELAHAVPGSARDDSSAWADELAKVAGGGHSPSVGVLETGARGGTPSFVAAYTGPPAYAPLRAFFDGACVARVPVR